MGPEILYGVVNCKERKESKLGDDRGDNPFPDDLQFLKL